MRAKDRAIRWTWSLMDALVWIMAIYGATWLRYHFTFELVFVPWTLAFALMGATIRVGVGALFGP